MTTLPSPELIASFVEIVGSANALTAEADKARYLVESRGLFRGTTPMVLRPGSVDEVSRIMKLASATRTAIVPQGGNTGHVAGQIPREGKADIVLGRAEVRKYPNSDMAAYPNSNQRALMIIPKSVATYWI